MRPSFAFGFDYGNSLTAGVAFTGDRRYGSVTFPSLATIGSTRQLEEVRSSVNQPLYGTDEYVLTFQDRETFLGKLAFESSEATAARGDVTRYWSTRSLEALLVASAQVIPHEEYEVSVVTGLPVETYSKEHRRLVREALEGDHAFFLNGIPRRALVHVSQVIMEGAGAIIAFGEAGEEIKQGAIDIGGRTTDLFATEGQTPRPQLCKGKPLGVENIGILLQRMIGEHLAGHSLEAKEVYRLLRASVGSEPWPAIYANGLRVPQYRLMAWLEQATEIVAKDIVSFVSSLWSSNERGRVASGFARLLLVGGGAYYFREQLRVLLPHLVVPREPELANALGYGALAATLGVPAQVRVVAS